MKTIKILGTGCAKCKQTELIVRSVVNNKGIDAEIIKVEDIMDIMQYNIMMTPAVVIDEEVKIKGRLPSEADIEELLR